MSLILAIESSCDETSAAVVDSTKGVISNIISSQYFHKHYGGVVPELASRAHIKYISQITTQSLNNAGITIKDIDALAVTSEPGLIGSLIVGANFTKGLAIRYQLPLYPINHIEGHIFSGILENQSIEFPFISLVVSGGHTVLFKVNSFTSYDVLGSTIDDAAGEAFDKIAKMLGLQYPGGPVIDKLAKSGNAEAYNFPRSMMHSGDYNFSFSGLKTSVKYFLAKNFALGIQEQELSNLAASIQESIVDVLCSKSLRASIEYGVRDIVIAGGVSANSRLRAKMEFELIQHWKKFYAPKLEYCMDNAAMIGFIAAKKHEQEIESGKKNFTLPNLRFKVSANSLRTRIIK